MCGIAGWFGKDAGAKVKSALTKMSHRGGGGSRIVDVPGGAIGHNLHATAENIERPFVDGDFWLVADCEIYNWKELAAKHGVEARNDAELVFKLIRDKGTKAVRELDGPYAIAFHDGERHVLRDKPGVFPVFTAPHCFASERKAFPGMRELHPRHIWVGGTLVHRGGFGRKKSTSGDIDKALGRAARKRLHEDTTLFLSGIDSALVAHHLRDSGIRAVTVGLSGSPDLKRGRELASLLDIPWEGVEVPRQAVLDAAGKVSRLIESSDPVKVEVGLVTYFAARKAGKVSLTGLGADELFGGYARMHRSPEREAYWALRNIYERSTYRDNVIGFAGGTEIRLPYLDSGLIELAAGLDPELKKNKRVLRELAEQHLGVVYPKKAAQYGSGFSRVLPQPKAEYLSRFVPKNRKLVALVSGGKDSWYAMENMLRLNYDVVCAVVMVPGEDSWMFHVPLVEKAPPLLEKRGIPPIIKHAQDDREGEVHDMAVALEEAMFKGAEGVVSGAISSEYQRRRIERVAESLGLSTHAPLWGVDQAAYLRRLAKEGFKFRIVSVSCDGLTDDWVGRSIGPQEVEELIELAEKHGFNPAGEGGEYETFVETGF